MTIAEKTVMAPFRPSSSNIYTPAGRFCLSAMSMGLLRSWSGSGMPDWCQTTLSRFAINCKRGSKTNKPGVLKGSPFVSRGLSRDEQYQKLERLFAEILCHSGPLASHPAAG